MRTRFVVLTLIVTVLVTACGSSGHTASSTSASDAAAASSSDGTTSVSNASTAAATTTTTAKAAVPDGLDDVEITITGAHNGTYIGGFCVQDHLPAGGGDVIDVAAGLEGYGNGVTLGKGSDEFPYGYALLSVPNGPQDLAGSSHAFISLSTDDRSPSAGQLINGQEDPAKGTGSHDLGPNALTGKVHALDMDATYSCPRILSSAEFAAVTAQLTAN